MNIKFDDFEIKFTSNNMLNHSYRLDFLDIDSIENMQNGDIFDEFAQSKSQDVDKVFEKAINLFKNKHSFNDKPMNTLLWDPTPNTNSRNACNNLLIKNSTSLVLEKFEPVCYLYSRLNEGEWTKNKFGMVQAQSDMCLKELTMVNYPSCEATAGYFSSGNLINDLIYN